MILSEITKAKFIDSGECLEYLKQEFRKVEVHEMSDGVWERSFFIQYDKDDFSLAISGRISEEGYFIDNGNDLAHDWKRETITIYDFSANCYLNGDQVKRFKLNGMNSDELEIELTNSL